MDPDHNYSSKGDEQTFERTYAFYKTRIAELIQRIQKPRPKCARTKLRLLICSYISLKMYCSNMLKCFKAMQKRDIKNVIFFALKAKKIFECFDREVRVVFTPLPLKDVKAIIINFNFIFHEKNDLLNLFCL